MLKIALISGLVGAALAAPVQAHDFRYADGQKLESTLGGVMEFKLLNKYDEATRYVVEVFDPDRNLIDATEWRSTWDDDMVTLAPGQAVPLKVQLRHRGKYLVCTRAVRPGFQSRTCAQAVAVRDQS